MITTRFATDNDAADISKLLAELGYPATPDLVVGKLAELRCTANGTVIVAVEAEELAGVISLHLIDLFHSPGRLGRITALVVASGRRRTGIGASLVRKADEFFQLNGCVRSEVTSGDHRPAAHAFYNSLGYLPDERRFLKHYEKS